MENWATYYRPSTFEEVVGQENTIKILKNIIKNDVAVRAILIQGSYGSGKTTLARLFGKALNCESFKKTGHICNKCDHCKSVDAGVSQYYLEFDSSKVGNIDFIKDLQSMLVPSSKKRVVLFDEAHAVSSKAFTALLKLIEEGIPNTYFMFTTTESLPETIESRGLRLNVSTINPIVAKPRIQEILKKENIDIEEQKLDKILGSKPVHMRNLITKVQLSVLGDLDDDTDKIVYGMFMSKFTNKQDKALSYYEELIKKPYPKIKDSIESFILNLFSAKEGNLAKLGVSIGIKLTEYFYSDVSVNMSATEEGLNINLLKFLKS